MAGFGESCSHVASLLWAIEAGVQVRDSLTVTQKKAYWVLPTSTKDVPYAPILIPANCFFPLVKAGIETFTAQTATDSCMSNPLSASIVSPESK